MRGLIVMLLAAASAAPALETPLILTPQGTPVINTELLLQVNPGLGLMNYYQSTNQQLMLQTELVLPLRPGDDRETTPTGGEGPRRRGLERAAPGLGQRQRRTPMELLAQFAKDPLREFPDLPSPQAAALKAEDAFWSKPHAYDGIVRAAWNLDYVLLAVPSKHVLMFYETNNQKIELKASMNYGPVEMILTGYNTNPQPAGDVQRPAQASIASSRRCKAELQAREAPALPPRRRPRATPGWERGSTTCS